MDSQQIADTAPRAAAGANIGPDQSNAGPGSAGAASAAEEIEKRTFDARFAILSSVAYHLARESFLSRLGKGLTGAQVLFGTGALATLVAEAGIGVPAWLAFVSAVIGVVQLVVDPAGLARDHRVLRSRFNLLLADFDEAQPIASLAEAGKWQAARQRICADEPPSMRALEAIAYNEAVSASYARDEDAQRERLRISPLQRLTANLFAWRGLNFDHASR